MSLDIRIVPLEELASAPNLGALLAEYADEAGVAGLPHPKPHMASYDALGKSGHLTTICAFVGGVIIGFILVLVNVMPHYSVPVATLESFFVAKAQRATGAGLQLLFKAEDVAQYKGAAGVFIAAAVGGELDRILSHKQSYRMSHHAYFRSFI